MKKILSLGAGVQSSTVLLMSCYGEIEKLDAAIFADTGWETKATYKWLEFLKSESKKYGIQIYTVDNGNIREDILRWQVNYNGPENKRQLQKGITKEGKIRWGAMPFFILNPDGSKGMIRRQCTYEYKIRPLEKKYRQIAGYKKYQRIPIGTVETWKGISSDEANRANLSRVKWITFYYPLIDLRMSRNSCLYWFKKRGLPEPPRSSCIGCPYHNNFEWRKLRDESPEEWQDAVEFDKSIRKCGGMRGDVFIHADRIPLDEVDLRTDQDKGQMSLFSNECAGICGV